MIFLLKKPCNLDGVKLPHNVLLHSPNSKINSKSRNDRVDSPRKTSKLETSESTVLFHKKSTTMALFSYILVTLRTKSRCLCSNRRTCVVHANGTYISRWARTWWFWRAAMSKVDYRHDPDRVKIESRVSAEGRSEVRHVLKRMHSLINLDLPFKSIDEQTLKDRQHLRTVPISSYNIRQH